MSHHINTNGLETLKTSTLAKSGGEYTVVVQSIKNLDHVAAFHQYVCATLSEDEKPYVIDRNEGYFENFFEQGHVVLNVLHQGKLIAQALMTMPTQDSPYTGMTDMDMSSMSLEKIAVLGGAIVHPDYRGNRLQEVLTDARIALAEKLGRTEIISEVATGNSFSWSTLIRKGLVIDSIGTDPDNGTKLYNLHLNVQNAFNAAGKKQNVVCSQNNLEAQEILLTLGFKAVANDILGKTLTFAKQEGNRPTDKKQVIPGLYQQGR